jgi:hypothetical protein
LLLIAKQHDGRCIWPSRLPTLGVEGDFFGDVCRASAAAGIQVFAYYSVAIDAYQVELHPDWAYVDRNGEGCSDIGFSWACINSPYGEFVLGQIEELLTDYPVQSLWLDILALGPAGRECCCRWCRQLFRQRHGLDLELVTDGPQLGHWKIDCLAEFLSRVRALRDRLQRSALIAFNGAGAGFRRHPEAGVDGQRLFDLVDFLSDEGHEPRFESVIAKAMRAHGKPFEVLTSNGIANEWVGWVTKPASLLCLEGAIIGSHGGVFGIGLSALPDGDLPTAELEVVASTSSFLAQRRSAFGPQSAVADVRFLIQPFRTYRDYQPPEQPPPRPRLPRGGGHHVPPMADREAIVDGWWDAAREAHFTTDLVYERHLLQTLPPSSESSLLIVSANAQLSTDVCDWIRAFVFEGGCLLAEGHASLVDDHSQRRADFALADVLGVHFNGYTGAWDANYLDISRRSDAGGWAMPGDGLPNFQLHIAGIALHVEADQDTVVLARVRPPFGGEQTIDHHTASLYNPPPLISAVDYLAAPGIVAHRYGKGRSLYVSVGIGQYLQARRNVDPWAKHLAANLLRVLVPEPLLRTDAPPGVELVLNRAPDGRLLLHLLNNYVASEYVSAGEAAPRLAPIRVDVNETRLGPMASAAVGPPEALLPISRRELPGWASVTAPSLQIHQTITLHPEFPSRPVSRRAR